MIMVSGDAFVAMFGGVRTAGDRGKTAIGGAQVGE
jgi:hypothetical protein